MQKDILHYQDISISHHCTMLQCSLHRIIWLSYFDCITPYLHLFTPPHSHSVLELRHTAVCHAALEAVTSPHDYIDRKTKNVIFTPICSSEISNPNSTKFAAERPPNYANLQTKFEANHTFQSRDTSKQIKIKTRCSECHAAQKAVTPHHKYTVRKAKNVIFTTMYLRYLTNLNSTKFAAEMP